VALLVGGAGTLALWNDTSSIYAGTVTSGVLDIAHASPGSWSPELDLTVPGDTIVYTDPLEVTATDDNLKATATTNIGSISVSVTHVDAVKTQAPCSKALFIEQSWLLGFLASWLLGFLASWLWPKP
jgi:alternate signal-mediated exported protein